jgi:hypothetical protein
MKTEKLIDERSFSVYFQSRKDENDEGINGVVTFGGGNETATIVLCLMVVLFKIAFCTPTVDTERIEPKINYVNVTKQAGYRVRDRKK